jgi:hypothetical protein
METASDIASADHIHFPTHLSSTQPDPCIDPAATRYPVEEYRDKWSPRPLQRKIRHGCCRIPNTNSAVLGESIVRPGHWFDGPRFLRSLLDLTYYRTSKTADQIYPLRRKTADPRVKPAFLNSDSLRCPFHQTTQTAT